MNSKATIPLVELDDLPPRSNPHEKSGNFTIIGCSGSKTTARKFLLVFRRTEEIGDNLLVAVFDASFT
jgi:hypothetical protein